MEPKINPKKGNFVAIKIYFHQHQLNDCPGNLDLYVDVTVKTCHQILHSVPLVDADNVLIEEEVENHTKKAFGFLGEFTGSQKQRQRSQTRFCSP